MQALKLWLDRLLVTDMFVVIGGALWFLSAVICEARGLHQHPAGREEGREHERARVLHLGCQGQVPILAAPAQP